MDTAITLAEKIGNVLKAKGWKLCIAESCTGGLLGGFITSIPGASEYFDRGFITYSNEAKTELLDVPPEDIATFGAVSDVVAKKMAEGALKRSQAHVSVSITGIAGPTGGTSHKPVGTVYIACATPKGTRVEHFKFEGGREEIRRKSVEAALVLLWEETQT
jgi:nicotinamide-nucleotide amidase